MSTFSNAKAGSALVRAAQSVLSSDTLNSSAACSFMWLVSEALRTNSNPVITTVSDMQYGFLAPVQNGTQAKVFPVGLSLNTIKNSLAVLEQQGFISIERARSRGRGETLTIEVK